MVDRRVVEGVQGSAVHHEAPVDARALHLGGERVPLRGRHDRVFRPDPGPYRAADARRLARSARDQPVDCRDRAQVDAVAPEFQRDGAPGAVADGGYPVGVGSRFGAQHVERRMADAPHPVGISEQWHATGQHLFGVPQIAPTVEVEGQRHISQVRESIGPAALDVAEPRALWSEQHRGSAIDTGREREVPDHRQTVRRVLDRTRRNRRHETGL